jgi:hypothetical protein
MGLSHGAGGVMEAELEPGQRSTPERWGRVAEDGCADDRQAARPAARQDGGTAIPSFSIDWGRHTVSAARGAEVEADSGSPRVAEMRLPSKAAETASAWQQRFVNHLGASNERISATGLRIQLQASVDVAPRLSRL